MVAPAIPLDETERLASLRALHLLDTPPEERFDRIVRLATHVFEVPIAYVAMVDSDRQWFKAKCGIAADETGRDISFCGHTILQKDPLIIDDALKDPRFHDNPLVIREPHVRFYAGYPLAGPGGYNVGTLCLAAPQPRSLSPREIETLRELAKLTEHELNMMDLIRSQRELIETKNALAETQLQLARELEEASAYVRGLLPAPIERPVRTEWRFISSSKLGGDFFGYHWLDEDRLVLYLLDVCGHGVAAALLSVTIHNVLRRQTLPETRFDQPAEVMAALNRAFPMSENGNKFFSIWYGVFDRRTRRMSFANGGHPAPVLVHEAAGVKEMGESDCLIGVDPDMAFRSQAATLTPGARLYVFSDGVFEVERPDGQMLRKEGLRRVLGDAPSNGASRVQHVLESVQAWQGNDDFADDFSLLEVEFA